MIYFAQATNGGPVKVGYSANVPVRIKQLEALYGTPLAILATMEGGRLEEAAIHTRFAHLRFGRTEQFRPAPDLMGFIGRPLLAGPDPDGVVPMSKPSFLRLHRDAYEIARQAASITGESIFSYVSRVLEERARQDADKFYAEAFAP